MTRAPYLPLVLLLAVGCRSTNDQPHEPAAKPTTTSVAPPSSASPPVAASPAPTLTLANGEALAEGDTPNARVALVWTTPNGPLGLAAVVRTGTLSLRAFAAGTSHEVFAEPSGSVGVFVFARADGTVVVTNKNLEARAQGVGALLSYRVTRLAWDAAQQRPAVRERWSCDETKDECMDWPAWTDSSSALADVPSPIINVDPAKPAPLAEDSTDRPPTPAEIDRCARLLVLTSACGLVDDPEFGWVRGETATPSRSDAQKQCTVSTIGMGEGGRELPVKLLDAAVLGKLETAARAGCGALRTELDRVDPRLNEAGSEP